MDDRRFDDLTRSVTRELSRRNFLRLLTGGAVGGLLTVFGAPRAEATHFNCTDVGKACTRSRQCCSGSCRGPQGKKTCRAHDKGICKVSQDSCVGSAVLCGVNAPGACLCYVTTGGASFCGGNHAVIACTKDTQCEPSHGAGAACVPCGGETICVAKCPDPT